MSLSSLSSLGASLPSGRGCRSPSDFHHLRAGVPLEGWALLPDLREYQKELVARPNRGENTVICAPTGSGKTVVAAHIAIDHLLKAAALQKPARVVMVVPKVLLVQQQAKLLREYAKADFYVTELSGDVEMTGQAQLLTALAADVIVLTPQILVNMLTETHFAFFVADITLLLLDECHHTQKKNPYNVIMQHVREAEQKPHVVGLTASLGVGEAGLLEENKVLEHICRLCARLTATSITTVHLEKDEMKRFVQPPHDVLRYAAPCRNGRMAFSLCLRRCIQWVQELILPDLRKLVAQPQLKITQAMLNFPDPVEQFEKYQNAVATIDNGLHKLEDGDLKWHLRRGIDFLKIYHNAILQNWLLPASYALEIMRSELDDLRRCQGRVCPFQQHFTSLQTHLEESALEEEDKDVLRMLREELTRQRREVPCSRILVFCQRRKTAQLLARYMTEKCLDGETAAALVSTNSPGSRDGQTSAGQRDIINAFKRGDIKVLATTSVAEEGLDIASCNLIIKYNTMGNVIQLVQQRGRARAANSRSVLLAVSSAVYKKECDNKLAEQLMERVVNDIYKKGEFVWKQELRQEEEKQRKEREEKAENEKRTPSNTKYSRYDLLCSKCNSLVCHSTDMRVETGHFVCTDAAFWKKMKIVAKENLKVINPRLMVTGDVVCRCGLEVGRVVKLNGVFLPALRADSISFRTLDGRHEEKKKKWSAVVATLFFIPECSYDDRMKMASANAIGAATG